MNDSKKKNRLNNQIVFTYFNLFSIARLMCYLLKGLTAAIVLDFLT